MWDWVCLVDGACVTLWQQTEKAPPPFVSPLLFCSCTKGLRPLYVGFDVPDRWGVRHRAGKSKVYDACTCRISILWMLHLQEHVDPSLDPSSVPDPVLAVLAEVALICLAEEPSKRPHMKEVVAFLEPAAAYKGATGGLHLQCSQMKDV